MFPAGAPAQTPPLCDPQMPSAISFTGLPTSLPPARSERFGFRQNYHVDRYVDGRITVQMSDRFGRSFFRGSLPSHADGGDLLWLSLDPGNRWVSVTATYVETDDVSDCTRVIERVVTEGPPMRLVIRATRRGVSSLGPYRVGSNPTLGAAIRAFGEPSSVRSQWGGNGCRVAWPLIGLVIQFANFSIEDACSPRYGFAQTAAIRGSNGKLWRTRQGVRIGQRASRMRHRHRSARKHGARSWWLVTGRTWIGPSCGGGPCPYPILSTSVRAGKVAGFRLRIGAAGD